MALKVGIVTDGTFAGWVIAHDTDQPFTTTVRPVLDADGAVHFTQVLITGTTAGLDATPTNYIAPPTLRDVPLAPLASWVADRRDRFAELGLELPTIGVAADANPDLEAALADAEELGPRPRMRIAGAAERRKPRRFYERVAERYRWLVMAHDRHPAKTIATANNVDVTVVHQWVKKCRRDGLLGATVVGRAGDGVVRARPVEDVPAPEHPDVDHTVPRSRRKKGWDVDEGLP